MTWMCTTFYSYFWVPDRELPTKGLVSIPSHTPETVNETEVSPFYPSSLPLPPPLITATRPLLCLRVYCCLVWFVQLFVSPASEVVWYLSFLLPFLTCPVCLGESGEGHVSPARTQFPYFLRQGEEGDAAPACEVQAPRPLYSPGVCVYVFLDSCVNTNMCLSGLPDLFRLFS